MLVLGKKKRRICYFVPMLRKKRKNTPKNVVLTDHLLQPITIHILLQLIPSMESLTHFTTQFVSIQFIPKKFSNFNSFFLVCSVDSCLLSPRSSSIHSPHSSSIHSPFIHSKRISHMRVEYVMYTLNQTITSHQTNNQQTNKQKNCQNNSNNSLYSVGTYCRLIPARFG